MHGYRRRAARGSTNADRRDTRARSRRAARFESGRSAACARLAPRRECTRARLALPRVPTERPVGSSRALDRSRHPGCPEPRGRDTHTAASAWTADKDRRRTPRVRRRQTPRLEQPIELHFGWKLTHTTAYSTASPVHRNAPPHGVCNRNDVDVQRRSKAAIQSDFFAAKYRRRSSAEKSRNPKSTGFLTL